MTNAHVSTKHSADKIHKPDANGRTPGAVDVLQVTDTITGDNYFFRFPCVAPEMSAQKAQQTLKAGAPVAGVASSPSQPAAPAAHPAAPAQRVPQQAAHAHVAAPLKRVLAPVRSEMKANLAEAHMKVMQLERANEQLQSTLHNVESQLDGQVV